MKNTSVKIFIIMVLILFPALSNALDIEKTPGSNVIDEQYIDADIARDSEIPTASTDLSDTANISRLDAINVFTAKNTFTNVEKPQTTGVVSCPTLTDNSDGSITLGTDGVIVFQDALDGDGALVRLTCSTGNTLTLTDGLINVVYADYNAGSPAYSFTTNPQDFLADFRKIPVFRAYREGTELHINNYDEPGILLSNKALFKDLTLNSFQRQSGLVLSTAATRISTISAGNVWFGVKFQSLSANVAGTTGGLYEYYLTAGTWGFSTVTAYDSTYYSDGTDRQSLGVAKYVAKYFFIGVESDNHAYYIHGNTKNSIADALSEPLPVLPPVLTSHALYVGKIIIQQGATNGTAYSRSWGASLSVSGVTDHDDLSGIDAAGTGVLYGHVNADAQSLYGVKTFNSFPLTPSAAPTTDYQVANKLYADNKALFGDCTVAPCYDGTTDSGTILYWMNPAGTFWTALQGGATLANRSWRLPIGAAPSAGTTTILNLDEYGQMGQLSTIPQSKIDGFGASATPGIIMNDSDNAAGTGGLFGNSSGGANDIILSIGVEDSTGESTVYLEVDGVSKTVDFLKPTTLQAGDIAFEELSAGAKFQSLAVADLGDATTPSVLTAAETTNKAISNYKATGADHVFTMPAAHVAGNIIFVIGDEFQVDIEPASGANFVLNGTAMAADEHIQNTADTLYEQIVGYVATINGTLTWMFESKYTNFVEETP